MSCEIHRVEESGIRLKENGNEDGMEWGPGRLVSIGYITYEEYINTCTDSLAEVIAGNRQADFITFILRVNFTGSQSF